MDQSNPDPTRLPPPPVVPPGPAPDPFAKPSRPAMPPGASSLPGVLVVVGGVLVVIGVFLPWLTATVSGRSVSQNGMQIGTWGTLILGGFAAMRGLSMLRPATFRIQLGTPVIGGVLILGLMAMRWSSLQDAIRQTEALGPGVTATMGIGVWAVIAGGLCVLGGGLLQMQAQRRR